MEVCDQVNKVAFQDGGETPNLNNTATRWANLQNPVKSSNSDGCEDLANTSGQECSDVVFSDGLENEIPNAGDSSLSLIDLESACDINSSQFFMQTPEKTTDEDKNDFRASPIPFADGMDLRVAKTPTSCTPQVSSPFHTTHCDDRKRQFSISSIAASPIQPSVISSTPFHTRHQLASVTETFAFPANTTYNIEKDEVKADATFSKPANATYDAGTRGSVHPHNATYNAPTNPPPNASFVVGNSTFNVETHSKRGDLTFDKADRKPADATFDKGPGPGQCHHAVEEIFPKITDTSVTDQEERPSISSPGDTLNAKCPGSDGMNVALMPATTTNTSSIRQQQGKGLRKPLSLVNSSGNVRPKSNDSTTAPTDKGKLPKKSGRINPPRMNAAAMSRIQARSPQKHVGPEHQDENVASNMKPPASTTMLRKPNSRKSIVAPRKSLLPPPAGKSRSTSASSVPRPANRSSSTLTTPGTDKAQQGADAPLTPSKRKADSPKHSAGRTAKFDPNRPATTRPNVTSSSSLRTNGIVTSRIASLSNRSNSKLQRPQGSSVRSTQSVSSSSVSTSVTSVSSVNVPRSRSTSNKSTKAGTKRSRRSPDVAKPTQDKNAQCAVAMATLLDFVVNKLDGLSAPELAASKQCLERLVGEQDRTNSGLSSRVVELESAVRESRDSHERDVTNLTEKHEGELRALNETLQDLTERITKQAEDHLKEITAMNETFSKKIEDFETKHESEVAQLRLEWSEEKQAMEDDTEDLRHNMKTRVDLKVEELMQPYRNAHEENKSLRAVLEMKTAELHKSQLEISQQSDQHNEVRTLRDHVISLQQKNEDLTSQVNEKANEHRLMKQELHELRQSLDEQQHTNKNQQHRIEELQYRINSNVPSPASPFNPIFTPSPTNTGPAGGGDPFDTPVRKRPYGQNSSMHGNGHSTVTPSSENGTH